MNKITAQRLPVVQVQVVKRGLEYSMFDHQIVPKEQNELDPFVLYAVGMIVVGLPISLIFGIWLELTVGH